ncbi:MAG: site-2 protease family protein [Anaerolineae bacterium]|jgi:Zn-dependent protease/CBS domain-containing protein
MNRQGISLGRVLGIPIELDYSWFLIFALVVWTLASGYFPSEFSNWPTAEYWLVGSATAVVFFLSVLLHELGHSVVARHYGIPVSSIKLFVFGGVSQIETEPPSAKVELIMAAVGPLVSFALAGVFAALGVASASVAPLLALAKYLAYINAALGLFNLVPGFPLDGGRVFRAIVWGITKNLRRATVIAGTLGRFIGFLFILFGVYQVFTGSFVNGLWIGFIGWFLESAAIAQVRQQRLHDLLAGRRVSQAMSTTYTSIPPDMSLQQLVDHHVLGNGERSFVVEEGDKVDGLLTLYDIKNQDRTEWPTTRAAQVMIPLAKVKRVQPDDQLWAAIEEMNHDGVNQLPVMANGHVEGMLRRQDIISYLRNLQDLA